jgi:mono/diheme cytochrome c family protein
MLVVTAALGAQSAIQGQGEQGRGIYDQWCMPCHGTGVWEGRPLPGTSSLQLKYQGALPAALEERTDLTPEQVSFYVRRGVGGMPFFRKTEISDAELAALAAYLSRSPP